MHIPTVVKEGFEADDIIGTLAKQAEKEGYQVFMVTLIRTLHNWSQKIFSCIALQEWEMELKFGESQRSRKNLK